MRKTLATLLVAGAVALTATGCASSTNGNTLLDGFKPIPKPVVYLSEKIPLRDRISMKKTLEYRGYTVKYGEGTKTGKCTTPVQRIALARVLGNASWNPRFGGDNCHNPDVRLEDRAGM